MYVFHYDPHTLAYSGSSPVDFCQIEPGTVLVPAWATVVAPPPCNTAMHQQFFVPSKDAWEVRALPSPEPQLEPVAPEVTAQLLQDSLQSHLDAAAALMVRLKEGTA
jgi:hypothetical protein